MNSITINNANRTIELTKKFATSAKYFGSEAYKQLQVARKDYPNYRVVVKQTSSKKRDSFKGLTYGFMEQYIMAHDDDGTKLDEFKMLLGTSEEALAVGAASASYGEIKAWFLKSFPAFAEFQKKRDEMLAA